MAGLNRNQSIEFVIKPVHDLYLEGSLRKIPRVKVGDLYPCQMQKTQEFSCLFRHYAKHNGLRKEDLVFKFVDQLLPEGTPETVGLMPQDEIWVEHKNRNENEFVKYVPSKKEKAFYDQFRELLISGDHTDVTFEVGPDKVEIPAHKAILSARSDFFAAMFRVGSMRESTETTIPNDNDPATFRRMLEFIYTNDVEGLDELPDADLIELLVVSNEYLLDDLRILCEKYCINMINEDTITKLLLLSAEHNASLLRKACAKFVTDNSKKLALDPKIRGEATCAPELGFLLFESAACPDGVPLIEDSFDSSNGSVVNDTSTEKPNNKNAGSRPNTRANKRRRLSSGSTEANQNTSTTNNNNIQSVTTIDAVIPSSDSSDSTQ